MTVLITGGTGMLGRELVEAAERAGHRVRIASRRAPPREGPAGRGWARMDLVGGEGISEALAGVDAVIHAASDPRRADAVDVMGTRRLVAAARAAGTAHLIHVSIVGIDEIPFGYYQRKLEAERIIVGSGVPFSIVRATQFHGFVDMLLAAAARVPLVLPVPSSFLVQSVAVSEVAERLVGCVSAGPRARMPDFGGPEVLTLDEVAEQWKLARAVRKPVMRLPVFGRTAAAFRAGRNTTPDGERGRIKWDDWLRTGSGSISIRPGTAEDAAAGTDESRHHRAAREGR